MPPTGAYMNSSGWQFTIQGGTTIPINRVKDWSLPDGVSRIREGADYDHYNTLNACDFEDPTLTLSTLDPFVSKLVPATVIGTVTGVVRDANNGAVSGGGAKQITLYNATKMDGGGNGAYRQFARGQIGFCGTSADGVTSPLSITAL